MNTDSKGSIGKHDWCINERCEDGYLVFVDDRPLSYRPTLEQAKQLAMDVIADLIADGDYRLNDRPAGFRPPKRRMKVIKPGVVHEYNADGSYNYTVHVEAQLVVLERLAPEKGQALRSRFEALRNRQYVDGDHIRKVAGAISETLDRLAPPGLYFGIPRDNSNIAGFWPEEWMKPVPAGPTDAIARAFGPCELG